MTEPNLTQLFLGPEEEWPQATLAAESIHPLWGGWAIRLPGAGEATVRAVAPGARIERRFTLPLDPDERRALLQRLIDLDLISIRIAERKSYIPDETSTTLTLSRDRRSFAVTLWAHDPPLAGLRDLLISLQAFVTRATIHRPASSEGETHAPATAPTRD
ncbi:MAG TPA: hypothetical protein PLG23_11525 [Thermoflexales bacterium]|nr:hypothetical protein [Thermoflexales bacterium]HQY24267.1 hypothetical protein [Thermoflexales bacterium]HQZ54087.1 hypothetical protein [Thermoflexales bacterium]HRA54891.1 hypothetical protein [Thermoflexales bacterium]